MSKCKIYSKDEIKELVESMISNMDIILTDVDIQPKEKKIIYKVQRLSKTRYDEKLSY